MCIHLVRLRVGLYCCNNLKYQNRLDSIWVEMTENKFSEGRSTPEIKLQMENEVLKSFNSAMNLFKGNTEMMQLRLRGMG